MTLPSLTGAKGLTCRHPKADRYRSHADSEDGLSTYPVTFCGRCGKRMDETAMRRGKSARRLGGDQERRIERVYGPEKIGERGDPVDHLGRLFKWQSKATRGAMPQWLIGFDVAWFGSLPVALIRPMQGMDGLYGDRYPLVIRSFVRTGIRTVDRIIVRAEQWRELHGGSLLVGYWVMTGDYFLEVNGRDTP